jgi:phosphatidylethanolamine-binding protein (PEBP) family uncharacterized protein
VELITEEISLRGKLLLMGTMVLGGLMAVAVADAAEAPTGFIVTSSTFNDGPMPVRTAYTKTADYPWCVGQNISPALSWAHPYPGVKSYAVTMIDLEDTARDIDLVVYGIPANITSFAEGEFNHPSDEFVAGKGSRGQGTWRGMCPPAGMSPHHYAFMVKGTDLDPKALPAGLTAPELDAALKGHVRGAPAVIVGTFARPK